MPIKYLSYEPETIKGQAILDNFARTRRVLRYRDNDKVYQRILRGMPLYEAELLEQVGGDDDSGESAAENLLIRGECLSACAYLKERGVEVDLVYIDPPFASGADYAKKVYLRRNPKAAKELAAKEAAKALAVSAGEEVELDELRAFEEKMYGDIWNKEDYLNWMYENLAAIKAVMSDTASIYVHLDWHIAHYVKILMDEVFGEESFRNEIVWQRVYSHNDTNKFGHIHDVIFFYSMNEEHIWNQQYTPYSENYLKMYGMDDGDGRRYKVENTLGPGGRGVLYEWNGHYRAWRYSKENMAKLDKEGKLYYTKSGFPKKKVYLDEMPGKPLQSIWDDINLIAGQANELLDYATQKPEALLERIIKASSNENMIVADFFGGSGVTAAVAHRLNRKFIHVDVGINSIQTTRDRLKAIGAQFQIQDIKDGVSLFRNPQQTMDKLKSLIVGLANEDGLDDFWEGAINDSKQGSIPVYLPNLLNHTTKVLDLVLVHRLLNQALPDLADAKPDVTKVIVYYIDIYDRAEVEAFIKAENPTRIQIELRDLKEILDEVVINDSVEYETRKTRSGYELELTNFASDRLQQKIDAYNQKRALNGNKKQQAALPVDNGDGEDASPAKLAKFKPLHISAGGLELIEYLSLDCTNKAGAWHSDVELKIDKNSFVANDGAKTKTFWDGTIRSQQKPLRLKVRNIAGDESIIDL